ncbi:HlyD family efflux transporter periplasmic adaptor subunit [bacterium]|nr:HlyD family efflux transporter periplasmic adaptor subunit [bacterium]
MTVNTAPAQTAAPPAPAQTWSPGAQSWAVTCGAILAAAAGVALVLYAWDLPPFDDGAQSTSNAFVHGRTTTISPQVAGYIAKVEVADYQSVTAGTPLIRIDDAIYAQRVAAAKANLDASLAQLANNAQARATGEAALDERTAAVAAARAALILTQSDTDRAEQLAQEGTISRHSHDAAIAGLAQARAAVAQAEAGQNIARQTIRTAEVARAGLAAQVEAARAQLNLAQIDLDHTVIRAPESGQLGEVRAQAGEYVTSGAQLLSLVPAGRWVIANFKEAQTARMAPGDRVDLTLDALDGAHLAGHIERLAPATGAEFSVLKPDNGTGNFIKIPQRIGVRITIDADQPLMSALRPGMSVEARVESANRP